LAFVHERVSFPRPIPLTRAAARLSPLCSTYASDVQVFSWFSVGLELFTIFISRRYGFSVGLESLGRTFVLDSPPPCFKDKNGLDPLHPRSHCLPPKFFCLFESPIKKKSDWPLNTPNHNPRVRIVFAGTITPFPPLPSVHSPSLFFFYVQRTRRYTSPKYKYSNPALPAAGVMWILLCPPFPLTHRLSFFCYSTGN